jgi:hypothetical protein
MTMSIGPDEQRILDALTPPLKSQAQKDLEERELRGLYKIEIHFGKDRSASNLRASVGAILIWESGRRFHGGGDEKMYWCGWKNCDKPIKTSMFGAFHAVCPHCGRENFLSADDKQRHIDVALRENNNIEGLKNIPWVVGEKMFRLPPNKLAAEIERHWRNLECKADIYLKYHPSDIRYRILEETARTPDQLEKARRLRGLLIYPVKNQVKDLAAGASAQKRFLAMITA